MSPFYSFNTLNISDTACGASRVLGNNIVLHKQYGLLLAQGQLAGAVERASEADRDHGHGGEHEEPVPGAFEIQRNFVGGLVAVLLLDDAVGLVDDTVHCKGIC